MAAALLALFAALPAAALGQSNAIDWPERLYNPSPADDDVILPLPCQGAMAFRRVYVPGTQPLDDHAIQIGQDGTGWEYVEHSRPAFVAGSFTSDQDATLRYYLMAKYELSELQYAALTADECPKPSTRKRLPQVSLSWFDAMDASNAYNLWLRKNARDALPEEDATPGFVRLPTEVEWEYAARGGLEVDTSDYRGQRYPMADGLGAHEWYAGAQSSNGRLQLAGLLEPNPLGLHDMLGNASEMMFEPFHLNKLDRQHGQAGGSVVRGGNFLSTAGDIRTSLRREAAYYNDADPQTERVTGMRLVMVAPSITSREQVNELEQAWQSLGRDDATDDDGKDTTLQLASLASSVDDSELQDELNAVEQQLRASNQRQEEARNQAIRASLNLGAFLCTKMQDDGVFFDFLQKNYRMNCEGESPDASCGVRKERLDQQRQRLDGLGSYYASSLIESATLYGRSRIERQVDVFADMLSHNAKLSGLEPYLHTYWEHQRGYLENQRITADAWLKGCKNMAEQ
ncbi:MAG: formylglycine-generating enzyme family protein [Halomonas subglaciescola]|nr:formylglycine-generating enzyme family protein [Halomonas subglaciescola]